MLDNRRTFIRAHRRNFFAHVCDLHGVCDHDLVCLLLTQIGKLFQHLLGRAQVKRRLIICILKAFTGHNNTAVHLILRIEKMYVAGRHDRLFVTLSELYDLPVQILQIFDRLAVLIVFPRHEHIIADRLDLQIIIEFHQTGDL